MLRRSEGILAMLSDEATNLVWFFCVLFPREGKDVHGIIIHTGAASYSLYTVWLQFCHIYITETVQPEKRAYNLVERERERG